MGRRDHWDDRKKFCQIIMSMLSITSNFVRSHVIIRDDYLGDGSQMIYHGRRHRIRSGFLLYQGSQLQAGHFTPGVTQCQGVCAIRQRHDVARPLAAGQ